MKLTDSGGDVRPGKTSTAYDLPDLDDLAERVNAGDSLASLAVHYRVPDATIGRWVDAANLRARRTRPDTQRNTTLGSADLHRLYTELEWTADMIATHIGVNRRVVLTELHSHAIAVRRANGQPRPPLLHRLHTDAEIAATMRRHNRTTVTEPGLLRDRFPVPEPLTEELLYDLHTDIGLSTLQISLLTGHGEPAIRAHLQRSGIPARQGPAPWTTRTNQKT